MIHLIHLTLNTGHIRVSPRNEVSNDVIAALQPVVRAGGGLLPGPPGYRMTIDREGRNAVYTIYRIDDGGATAPLVTCTLAQEASMRTMTMSVQGMAMPVRYPWLAVEIHGSALADPESIGWLGDLERCIAWTIIEEDR